MSNVPTNGEVIIHGIEGPRPLTYDKEESARLLGVPIGTVLNLTRTGQLRSIMVGRHRRWVLEDLWSFVEAMRTGPESARKSS